MLAKRRCPEKMRELVALTCSVCGETRLVSYRNAARGKFVPCVKCAGKSRRKYVEPRGTVDAPLEGDVRQGYEIGKGYGSAYIWRVCINCGKAEWITNHKGAIPSTCNNCARRSRTGPRNGAWQTGRVMTVQGYVEVYVPRGDFFHSMTTRNNYAKEHRIVMARHLGRCLQPWEVVHHKNGIKDDNRIENLEIVDSAGNHTRRHNRGYRDGYLQGLLDGKDQRIKDLKARIEELESRLGVRL